MITTLPIISSQLPTYAIILITILMLWTLPWKGYALWRASRNKQNIWFIALFLLNTLAILEILYIFFFQKDKNKAVKKKK